MFDMPRGLSFVFYCYVFFSCESSWIELWAFIACQEKTHSLVLITANPNFVSSCRTITEVYVCFLNILLKKRSDILRYIGLVSKYFRIAEELGHEHQSQNVKRPCEENL